MTNGQLQSRGPSPVSCYWKTYLLLIYIYVDTHISIFLRALQPICRAVQIFQFLNSIDTVKALCYTLEDRRFENR
jgi:hypothetical protein